MDSALYREQILEHARRPRNSGRVAAPDAQAVVNNPLCGDELEATLTLADGCIREVRFLVRGCAIAQASASLTSLLVQGLAPDRVAQLGRALRAALEDPDAALPPELEPLAALTAVRQHRSRVRCALLAWDALAACTAPAAAESGGV
jgi:nitrogen fixation NifU-like protein